MSEDVFSLFEEMSRITEFDAPTAEATVATAGAIVDAHVREIMRKRSEMVNLLAACAVGGVMDDWVLVEEVSADGLKTTWSFEKRGRS